MNRTRRAFALAATIAALAPLGTTASASVLAEGTPMPGIIIRALPDGTPMPARHVVRPDGTPMPAVVRPDGTPMPAVVRIARPCAGRVLPPSRISPDEGTPMPACG